MNVSNPTDCLATCKNLSSATRLQPTVLLWLSYTETNLRDAKCLKQTLNNALGVKEIVGWILSIPSIICWTTNQYTTDIAWLIWLALVLVSKKHTTQLIHSNVRNTVSKVVRNRAQKARNNRAAHLRLVSNKWAHNLYRHASSLFAHAKLGEVVWTCKQIRLCLVEAKGAQRTANLSDLTLI